MAAGAAARSRGAGIDPYPTLSGLVAGIGPLLLVLIVAMLAIRAWPALSRAGGGGLLTGPPFGAAAFLYGTLMSGVLALLGAAVVGIGAALFLAEPGAARLRGVIGAGVEMLGAVPSVVYGLWGLVVLAPWLVVHVDRPVVERLGGVPLLAGPPRGTSLFAAAVVLAVMIVPTLAAIARDVLRRVPAGLRENSLALGATWWETTWKVILPAAWPGLLGALALALGRALGETVAVAMVIGNQPRVAGSIFAPAATLASVVATRLPTATGALPTSSLLALGLILVLVMLAVNGAALLLMRRVRA